MDDKAVEMYLQNLEEFVLDEDKIVTYKWLSKTLNIHVNLAKQLLFTFSSQEDKQNLVSATYLLGGRLRSSGESCITVVGQDKYDQVKTLFESLSSEHVYSVQKTQHAPIPGTLFTVNSQPVACDEDASSSLGAIRCKESVRRAAEELALLRITVAPTPSTSFSSKPPKPTTSTAKEPEKESPSKVKGEKTSNTNGKEPKDGKVKAKGGLAAMFAAQTVKAASKTSSAPATASAGKSNGTGKASGISNFFSKVNKEEQAEKEAMRKEESQTEKSENDKEEDEHPSKSSSSGAKGKVDKESEPKASLKSKKQGSQKRSRTKEKKEEGKKRKRIVIQESESSDEDIFADEGNASSREPSPEPVLEAKALESEEEDVIAPTPSSDQNGSQRCRRRRKVTKDKTFMDDDGYVVTQKVTEYESYSESDSEAKEIKKVKEPLVNGKATSTTSNTIKSDKLKAASKKSSPAKSKSPTKSKQQSLTSFFKRKE